MGARHVIDLVIPDTLLPHLSSHEPIATVLTQCQHSGDGQHRYPLAQCGEKAKILKQINCLHAVIQLRFPLARPLQ
jgi:hypothetical protein